ncbi:MAG: XkdF-like putative serine protease domain-containing protein [Nitratireductor sp.]
MLEKYESTGGAQVVKVDSSLGLIFGWAIVSKVDGADYFDTQGDHIPEDSMLKASADFMANSRLAKEMHVGDGKGSVVFAWPMTAEIAKSMGITTKNTGLMIAMKPDSPEMLGKFADGTYTGFSIGGKRIKDEEIV